MAFLHPAILTAGLLAVSIPILIHLLMRRRKKPVMWGAMRFVLEAYRRTRRRLLIERWLLLACRCLLLAALAIGLGRPLLGSMISGASSSGRVVYVLIDNSLTAGVDRDGKPALVQHLDTARGVIRSLREGDRASIILLGGPARPVVLPPTADLQSVETVLAGVTAADSRADISGAMARVGAAITESSAAGLAADQHFVFLITDHLAGSSKPDAVLPRLPAGTRFISTRPRPVEAFNISVKDVRPFRGVMVSGGTGGGQPEQAQPIALTLERSGPLVSAPLTSTVSVRMLTPGAGGETNQAAVPGAGPVATATVRWLAGQREATATVAVDAPTGASVKDVSGSAVLVAQVGVDSLPADNTFRVPIEVRESLKVGLIGPPRSGRMQGADSLSASDWITLALRPREDSTIDLIDLEPGTLDAGRLGGLDAIIVTSPQRLADAEWARLRTFVEGREGGGIASARAAGVLIIVPPGDLTVHAYTDAMTRELGLPLTMSREPKQWELLDPARPRIAPAGPASGPDLLGAIRSEMDELGRPVNIWRALLVTPSGPNSGIASTLFLSDGTPLIITSEAGHRAGSERSQPSPTRANDPSAPEAASAPADPRTDPAATRNNGVVVLFTTALDLKWTDLPAKPLMVPLLQELVRQGIGRARSNGAALAGTSVALPGQTVSLRPWVIRDGPRVEDGAVGGGVGEYGQTISAVRTSGVWDALDSAGGRRGLMVVNPDASAGNIDALDPAALSAWLVAASSDGAFAWLMTSETPDSTGAQADGPSVTMSSLFARPVTGSPLGPGILGIALLFAVGELFLARRSSYSTNPAGGARIPS